MSVDVENKHYDTKLYQRTADIESEAFFGMTSDEKYKREVGLSLDKRWQDIDKRPLDEEYAKKAEALGVPLVDQFGISIGTESRVLDVACGEGDTSRIIAEMGAHVEARDLAETLIEKAKERTDENTAQGIRDRVRFAVGDMTDVKSSLQSPDERFDVVTCLGRSFNYLQNHEDYMKTLKDWFDVLEPGGSVVLQWRQHPRMPSSEIYEKSNMLVCEDDTGHSVVRDKTKGDGYRYAVDFEESPTPEGIDVALYNKTYLQPSTPDKIKSFDEEGRPLDAEGGVIADNETPFGVVKTLEYLNIKNLPLLKKMLGEVGFNNVRLKGQNLASDGSAMAFAIAADKPA